MSWFLINGHYYLLDFHPAQGLVLRKASDFRLDRTMKSFQLAPSKPPIPPAGLQAIQKVKDFLDRPEFDWGQFNNLIQSGVGAPPVDPKHLSNSDRREVNDLLNEFKYTQRNPPLPSSVYEQLRNRVRRLHNRSPVALVHFLNQAEQLERENYQRWGIHKNIIGSVTHRGSEDSLRVSPNYQPPEHVRTARLHAEHPPDAQAIAYSGHVPALDSDSPLVHRYHFNLRPQVFILDDTANSQEVPMWEAYLRVNNQAAPDPDTSVMGPRTGAHLLRQIRGHLQEAVSRLPEHSILYTYPLGNDRQKARYGKVFQRAGFGPTAPNGKQYAMVRGGRLIPLSGEDIAYLLNSYSQLFNENPQGNTPNSEVRTSIVHSGRIPDDERAGVEHGYSFVLEPVRARVPMWVASFNRTTTGGLPYISPRMGLRVLSRIKQHFQDSIAQLPEGTIVYNVPAFDPTSDNRRGHNRRAVIYQRVGFGPLNPDGKQYGIVRGGKLVPLSREDVVNLLSRRQG